jgi:hypothetical protein
MNQAQQQTPALNVDRSAETAPLASSAMLAPARSGHDNNTAIVATIHRGLHAAALHVAHHHINAYDAYANQPALDDGELHDILIEVTASGVDLDYALHAAHELAAHIMPPMVNGHPSGLTIVISDGEASHQEVESLVSLLKQLRKV